MKSLSIPTALLGLALSLSSFTAYAQESYRARLSPMPTTPQTVDTITGEGEVLFSLSGNTLTVNGLFEGMSTAATMAHIHNGPMAQPGPVVAQLEVTKLPQGEISASIELSDELVAALKNRELYVQVHSEGNPPGELRGWIFLRN